MHERRHTGKKPYTCPFCPFAAVTSSATTSHVASMHPGCDPKTVARVRVRRIRRVQLEGAAQAVPVTVAPSVRRGGQGAFKVDELTRK